MTNLILHNHLDIRPYYILYSLLNLMHIVDKDNLLPKV
eukprot:CAMPEP_0168601186 /NCGR_PEP_ID=MMETSP0420-20121227/13280_1 /TAXON_ID=498008 /ORGANISM="Pessonella sp." /LENGTH=37 /DNA_ID= /DNA_START= /DNA_END= /DNA_ORIENTATION=